MMSLKNPVSCVSNAFLILSRRLIFICYVCCHQTDQICSMSSLTNLGMDTDPLVRTILRFFFTFWRVRLWCLCFGVWCSCTNRSRFQRWYFCLWGFHINRSWFQRWLTPWNVLVLKFLILKPNLKISFIILFLVRICLSHSNHFSFTKNMIMRAPMRTIHTPSVCISGGTEITNFIQCIIGWYPQNTKLGCLGLDRIFCEVHPTVCEEIPDVTITKFVTDYLANIGRQFANIGKLSVNDSVQFLVLSDQAKGSRLLYIANLLAQVEATGWGSSNNYNQSWGGHFNDANNITNVAWGISINASPTNLMRSPELPLSDQCRVCLDFLRHRHQERLWC